MDVGEMVELDMEGCCLVGIVLVRRMMLAHILGVDVVGRYCKLVTGVVERKCKCMLVKWVEEDFLEHGLLEEQR